MRDQAPEHMLRDLVPEHMLRDLVPDSPKPNLLLKRFYFSRTACDGFPCVQIPLYQIQKRPELKPDLLLSRFYFSSGSTFNVALVVIPKGVCQDQFMQDVKINISAALKAVDREFDIGFFGFFWIFPISPESAILEYFSGF